MANKYDITSGLTEYKSMYYDIGVDKYIDAVKSLRETHDKNLAGINLVNEAVQSQEFMPMDDEIGRTYMSTNINSILEGAVDAPEEASMQVNKAAQFFSSDPTASGYRRNANEYLITKEVALNTPGGWSSMIMFGDNPMTFKTVNEDGSLNQYTHQAEGRLDQESKFLNMVGAIAQDTGILGPEYQDIDGDGIVDVLVSGSSTGVSNRKADRIVDGIMEQFLATSEGKQALRELLEVVGGNPPVTDSREEAKRIILERMRPLVQNQVGFTKNISTSQISGDSRSGRGDYLYGSMPSLLLDIVKNNTTTLGPAQMDGIGLPTGTIISTDGLLNDYASALNFGYLKEVDSDYEIVPGFKPFENLNEFQKVEMSINLMDINQFIQDKDYESAKKILQSIPGGHEALRENGTAFMEGIKTFYKNTSKTDIYETRQALGVLMNANINGAIVVNKADNKVRTINRNGQTVVGIETRLFLSNDQVDNLASREDLGTPGTMFGWDWNVTDIDRIKHPGTGELLFQKDTYNGVDGYYVTHWVEKEVDLDFQVDIDKTLSSSAANKDKNLPFQQEQIRSYNNHVLFFQQYKQAYLRDGDLIYKSGEQTDGRPTYDSYNAKTLVKSGSELDNQIQYIFDIMPQAAVSIEMSRGVDVGTFTSEVFSKVRYIISKKMPTKDKKELLQNLIEEIERIKTSKPN